MELRGDDCKAKKRKNNRLECSVNIYAFTAGAERIVADVRNIIYRLYDACYMLFHSATTRVHFSVCFIMANRPAKNCKYTNIYYVIMMYDVVMCILPTPSELKS